MHWALSEPETRRNFMKTEMIAKIGKDPRICFVGIALAGIITLALVLQVLMCVTNVRINNDDISVSIQRPDIFTFGGHTDYYSQEPWQYYNEHVTVSRLFGTDVVIQVGASKRVSRIHYIPESESEEAYILDLEDDGTVTCNYYKQNNVTTGLALEKYVDDFRWAGEQVRKARKRYAHLIPQNFKEALGIE